MTYFNQITIFMKNKSAQIDYLFSVGALCFARPEEVRTDLNSSALIRLLQELGRSQGALGSEINIGNHKEPNIFALLT